MCAHRIDQITNNFILFSYSRVLHHCWLIHKIIIMIVKKEVLFLYTQPSTSPCPVKPLRSNLKVKWHIRKGSDGGGGGGSVFLWNVRFHVSAFKLMGKCLMMINCGIFCWLLFTFFHSSSPFSLQPFPYGDYVGMWHRKNLRSMAIMTLNVNGFTIELVPIPPMKYAFIYTLEWTSTRANWYKSTPR